jgi:hypothetical protein
MRLCDAHIGHTFVGIIQPLTFLQHVYSEELITHPYCLVEFVLVCLP